MPSISFRFSHDNLVRRLGLALQFCAEGKRIFAVASAIDSCSKTILMISQPLSKLSSDLLSRWYSERSPVGRLNRNPTFTLMTNTAYGSSRRKASCP
jgi:hypothetical protein